MGTLNDSPCLNDWIKAFLKIVMLTQWLSEAPFTQLIIERALGNVVIEILHFSLQCVSMLHGVVQNVCVYRPTSENVLLLLPTQLTVQFLWYLQFITGQCRILKWSARGF